MKNQPSGRVVSIANKKTLGARLKTEWKNNYCLYIFAFPIILYFIMFNYIPMFGLTIAFKNYNIGKGVFGSEWVGFKYFIEFVTGTYFIRTMTNTLAISILNIIFSFPFPIIFALLLNEVRCKIFKKVVQTTSYLPHFISMVVICGMIKDFCSTDGLITSIIASLGGENLNYIGSSEYFRTIYVSSGVWQTFGWNSIIYLAALSGIDEQLYEAASIDGAGRFRKLINVTLPGIANTVIIMLILRLGHVLSVGYEKIILLYTPQIWKTRTFSVYQVFSATFTSYPEKKTISGTSR